MSTTTDRPGVPLGDGASRDSAGQLARAEGLELLGEVDGSGYRDGAALARRADGQMVQLGPLMYALLEELDAPHTTAELSAAMCEKLGRECDEQAVAAIAQRLAEQGLLAGTESNAPERSNPLLALRWKVVFTNPAVTRRLTAPFTWLFRPWVLLPVLAAFVAVVWFVLFEQGIASAAAHAFERPELILLLFGLGVAAAAFHEIGHASACRYGGGRPGAMGAGIYLVWPAFYTDVTDAYRLPTRARLRTDLGGLYFNSIVAVATVGAWLATDADALLLLVGLQLVEMVKQLSPVIRADGYHILSDATGVPDLYAHIGPTLKRLLPGHHREAAALTGRARLIVTAWVLVVVPVLLALMLSAVLLLPKLAASAWASGSEVFSVVPDQLQSLALVDLGVSGLRLLGLALPVLGGAYIAWRLLGGGARWAARWSRGSGGRRAFVVALAGAVAALLLWAWWPAGQYEQIRASDRGTIGQLVNYRTAGSAPDGEPDGGTTTAAPADQAPTVPAGTHLAIAMIPEGGATEETPALYMLEQRSDDGSPIIIAADGTPPTAGEPANEEPADSVATAFSFDLPDAPREDDNQALAVNRTDGGIVYTVAYSLVTVRDGDPVDQRNSAHAYANCVGCTTLAVSFQVVLVVGNSPMIAPINLAEALNGNCPYCVTTAIANQIVLTVGEEPSPELLEQLQAELERLEAIDDLEGEATPSEILALVSDVHRGVNELLADSGEEPEEQAAEQDTSTGTTDPDDATPPEGTDPAPDEAGTSDEAATEDPATDEATEPVPTPEDETTTTTASPAEATADPG